jgi:hypothetical protein
MSQQNRLIAFVPTLHMARQLWLTQCNMHQLITVCYAERTIYYYCYSTDWSQNFTFCWPFFMLWFLVNDQRDAQFYTTYLFLFLTLYMFRAHRAHHQERQIVSIQTLLTVTLCQCPYHVKVRSSFPTCTWHGHRHRVMVTRGCIDTISLLMTSTMCLKHVELKIKINT